MQVLVMTYDEDRDAFIPKKPFNSWLLNEDTCNMGSTSGYATQMVIDICLERIDFVLGFGK
jgi:hypothetical protein